VLNIERLKDGSINLNTMKRELADKAMAASQTDAVVKAAGTAAVVKAATLPKIVTLPENFLVKDGKLVFLDRLPYSKPYQTSIEAINTRLSLKLGDDYTELLNLSLEGEGRLNGNDDEAVKWTISMDPTTQLLTMSNRFEVFGLDITALAPYYDKYSPFVFRKGRFSGTLIYDFDNGNIGSTNEIHLSDLAFYVKKGYENAVFWQTTVQDLAKYFTSSTGDIVFDFKIKGDMSKPKFYLGPISKQAIAAMAIDKITDAIKSAGETQQGSPQGPKSDIEKAREYIDLFKGLLDKK